GDLVHRGWSVPAMALVLAFEAVFSALWVRTNWLAQATTREFRDIAPWLAGTAALGVAISLLLGGQYKGLLIYVSIACAVALPLRWTIPAIALTTLIELGAEFRNPQYLGLAPDGRL